MSTEQITVHNLRHPSSGATADPTRQPSDQRPALRRLALNKRDAAAVLGVSIDPFERHVQPDLRCIRRGKLRLFAISELERWLDRNAARALD